MTVRSFAAGAAVAVGIALAPFQAAADAVLDGIAALPGSVEEARVGGTFERDGRIGFYRIVVARTGGEVVTARLFIQWVAYEDDGGATVIGTQEIVELAELGVDVVDFSTEADADGLSVFIQTLDPNGSADQTYELFVTAPDRYRFGEASN